MARAEGIWYWDVHGKRYLDGISGIFVVNVGHANPRVRAALHRQLDTLCFAPPLHATNVPAIELANLVASITPGDLNTVKLLLGRLRGHRGGDEAGPPVPPPERPPAPSTRSSACTRATTARTMGALSASGTSRAARLCSSPPCPASSTLCRRSRHRLPAATPPVPSA